MSTPQSEAKPYVSPGRRESASRPRLLELLDTGLERRFILILVPPGFGTTPLPSEWIATSGSWVAWGP